MVNDLEASKYSGPCLEGLVNPGSWGTGSITSWMCGAGSKASQKLGLEARHRSRRGWKQGIAEGGTESKALQKVGLEARHYGRWGWKQGIAVGGAGSKVSQYEGLEQWHHSRWG